MSNKPKVLKKVAGISLALVILSGGNVYASENVNELQVQSEERGNSQLSNAVKFFNKYDVDKKVQANLINKYNKGILWDSLKEGELPIRSEKKEFENYTETVDVYNDGSIIVTSMSEGEITEVTENEEETLSVLSVTPGTVTSGSGYTSHKGARVYVSGGLTFASFLADFTLVRNGNDYIGAVYKAVGGIYTSPVLNRKYETSTSRARAYLPYRYTYAGTTYSKTLTLYVGKDTYYSTNQ